MAFRNLSVTEAHNEWKKNPGIVMLDVRTAEERTGPCGHIPNSIHLWVEELSQRHAELSSYKDKEIIAICYAGLRSRKACEILSAQGFTKLSHATGGMMEWHDHGFEVVEGKPTPDQPEC